MCIPGRDAIFLCVSKSSMAKRLNFFTEQKTLKPHPLYRLTRRRLVNSHVNVDFDDIDRKKVPLSCLVSLVKRFQVDRKSDATAKLRSARLIDDENVLVLISEIHLRSEASSNLM